MSNINFANYGYSSSNVQIPSGLGKPTTVGTNGGPSFFGTYDQTGNISEHLEKKVLFSSDDSFTPATTPSGSQVFRSVINQPPPPTWPVQFTTPTPTAPPSPLPPQPPSYSQPPASQQFGYGNANRGGSFASDSGNLPKDSQLSFSVPSTPLDNVGFRIAAASNIYTITGVYIPSINSSIVYVPSGSVTNFNTSIVPFMDVDGNIFTDNTKVTSTSTSVITIGDTTYQRFSIDSQPIATGSGLTITVSSDNPLDIKNMVLVDLPNNSPDGFTPGYGRVNKNYYIGKYPVTNSEYAVFLNAVAKYDSTFVYYTPAKSSSEPNMSIGIHRSDRQPYIYRPVKDKDDKPVTGVTWLQAARYCNWLHRKVQLPTAISTNTGAYDLRQPLQTMSRSTDARYFLPSENEWYKAAYYGKDQGNNVYTKYATRSNIAPSKIESVDIFGNGPYRNLTDLSLFDRFRFDGINDLRWISIINRAADRWDKHLSHIEYSKITDIDSHDGYRYMVKNKDRYIQLQKTFEYRYKRSWRGLYLENFVVSTSSQNWIASCSPIHAALTDTPATGSLKYLPISFRLTINHRYETNYTDDEWVDIITHELGHALGFGVYWDRIDFTGTLTPIESDYFMNREPFVKTNIEYNRVAYGVEDGYTRLYTPLEQSGGTSSATHWEDNYITDGECFVPLNCAQDTPYVGIKDLMNGTYRKNSILSNITIANMVDLGYYSKDNTVAGEGDFQPIYSGIDPSTANTESDILGYCSRK